MFSATFSFPRGLPSPRASPGCSKLRNSPAVRVQRPGEALVLNRIGGLQVEGGSQAAVHVERHGSVLVNNIPGARFAMQAERFAHPETDRAAGGLKSSAHAVEAVGEGEVADYGDVEVAGVQTMGPSQESSQACFSWRSTPR
jgi:hypothetical protein